MKFLYNVFANLVILALQLMAIAAAAMLGLFYPIVFAVLTALLTFAMALWLERQRLHHELPFYFEKRRALRWSIGVELFSVLTALFKAGLAALIAVLIFSGTEFQRLQWIAGAFALCVLIGSMLLRWLSVNVGAEASRWGFFRLAAPLGLLYAQCVALLFAVGVLPRPGVAGTLANFIDLPKRPGLAEASEFLFQIEQLYDAVMQSMISAVVPADWAVFIAALLSVKMLAGFVIAIYAVATARFVRWLEENS